MLTCIPTYFKLTSDNQPLTSFKPIIFVWY